MKKKKKRPFVIFTDKKKCANFERFFSLENSRILSFFLSFFLFFLVQLKSLIFLSRTLAVNSVSGCVFVSVLISYPRFEPGRVSCSS